MKSKRPSPIPDHNPNSAESRARRKRIIHQKRLSTTARDSFVHGCHPVNDTSRSFRTPLKNISNISHGVSTYAHCGESSDGVWKSIESPSESSKRIADASNVFMSNRSSTTVNEVEMDLTSKNVRVPIIPNWSQEECSEARANRRLFMLRKRELMARNKENTPPSIDGRSYLNEAGSLSSDDSAANSDKSDSENEYDEPDSELFEKKPQTVLHCFKLQKIQFVDFGDPTSTCCYCNALVWPDEKTGRVKSIGSIAFSLCCMKGKVQLPYLPKPPTLLHDLLTDKDPRSKNFKENIRKYNSMFAFTSMGGKVQTSINDGGGPPQFVLSGQNFHRIGSLIPHAGQSPKFAQLYIYDTQNEVQNRMNNVSSNGKGEGLDSSLVEDLKQMVDKYNVLASIFRRVRDHLSSNGPSQLFVRLFRARGKDPRTYNMPTADEVAALIVGDFDDMEYGRDVVVKMNDGFLTRIHETHTAFIPLQYPLIFPYGEGGFREDIPISELFKKMGWYKRHKVSLRQFISFRLQERAHEYGNVVYSKRLFQQFVIDTYTLIEANRLSYLRHNQNLIRSDYLNGIAEAIDKGETDPSSVGKRIILPLSFTGGRRYMFNNCQDAMSICKKFGYPDLFITATCNTGWGEIQRFVRARNLRAEDRPDICVRVFKMKLDRLISDLRKGTIFGAVDAGMYTVEFQKRGLPHAHILLWLKSQYKMNSGEAIDKYISAELPDPQLYPKLYNAVSSYMIHGPCGVIDPKSVCMEGGKCSKHFPKKLQNCTTIDDGGFPIYKKRKTGISVMKKGVPLDNSFVVPYNPKLLMRFQGHINVEYCNKSNAIKYLFKYINKGPDRVNVQISSDGQGTSNAENHDEIKQYYDCRYLTPCEAAWRTFKFDIHDRWPPVMRLEFHLPNQQCVLFEDDDDLEKIVEKCSSKQTQFLAWMAANKLYPQGRNLTYAEFPYKFVYKKGSQEWVPRKRGLSLGRLQYIQPGMREIYYLRILLIVQRGCDSFESIKTVDGVVYPTFHDACEALGYMEDDREYVDGIIGVSGLGYGHHLRDLFVRLLITNSFSQPKVVWEKTWSLLSDGFLYERRRTLNIPGLQIEAKELMNLCLIEIENLCQSNGRSLKEWPCLPYPSYSEIMQFENRFVADELNYNKEEIKNTHDELVKLLTIEQKGVYDQVLDSVLNGNGGFFFLYGFGGTGKTFVWNTLSAALRSKGLIVLNVASSGIASLLLPGGRTAHSRFSIPIDINEISTCNVRQGTLKAELLQKASLIIWDEAPMLNKHCFEALDRTLNDIMKTKAIYGHDIPFGGKVVVLGGDFRQVLPVILKGSRSEIVGSTLNSSYLWKFCKVLKLTTNMRLQSASSSASANEIRESADWILEVGDGTAKTIDDDYSTIEMPSDLLISSCEDPLLSLVNFAYPNFVCELENFSFFEERAILAPTLDSVEQVNNFMLSLIPGEEREYLSYDTPCRLDQDTEINPEWFTTEFLNDIHCSGIPNHRIVLKVGVPIMLLRNLDHSRGLCNGTRMMVTDLTPYIIVATLLSRTKSGEKVYIARQSLTPSDPTIPFKFQRRQFPITLSFAMTINKSQGQSLSHVGSYLPKPVFTHGQLYVALSRVKSRKRLEILILDDEGAVSNSTKNVVYQEVFDNI
ncbi:hypothetical protein OROGR_019448 [Orobanche gracilis]